MATVIASSPTASPPSIGTDSIWRISVDRYHAMIEKGVITDDDRVELLDGMLVEKISKNPPHSLVTGFLRETLDRMMCDGRFLNCQEPIALERSEPEPDLAIIRGRRRDFWPDRNPAAADTMLVVEVSDDSLSRDRGLKLRLYAQANIPCYWIANIAERQIEVYSDPSPVNASYSSRRDYRDGERVPVIVDGVEIGDVAVADCLP